MPTARPRCPQWEWVTQSDDGVDVGTLLAHTLLLARVVVGDGIGAARPPAVPCRTFSGHLTPPGGTRLS